VIRVANLTKRYGPITAVRDVSFEVKAGEIFAFLGPNGAGKTTTIKILTTLLKPTSGEVQVDGFSPTRNQAEVRKRFGIVFQDPSLDDQLTAFENMDLHGALYAVPKHLRKERIEQLLNLFQLWDATASGNCSLYAAHAQDYLPRRTHTWVGSTDAESALDPH
jgi:ABC-2 type transport system ATP-binding protein